MTSTRTDQVTVADGSFDVHVALPDRGWGPGIVLVQEIFGVGAYIRAVAERLAARGYVVGAPDLFWRFAPGHAADHDEAGLAQSMELVGQLDGERAVGDCLATAAHLATSDEVRGGVGVVGFCLGGTIAVGVGIAGDPTCVVSYYGSGVADMAEQFIAVTCPVLLHFGDSDPFIPNRDVDRIREVISGRANWDLHVQPGAGHAFDNHEAAAFHDPPAAAAAWAITEQFLAAHLPAGDLSAP
jgi:carboxymethylenebutenolidase